jgi:hypothetical protein
MKRLIAFGALACALALGACASGSTNLSQDVEKGLIASHIAFEGAGVALRTAATTGVLHGTNATLAQGAYDQFATDLKQADADWALADTAAVTADLAKTSVDQANASALIPSVAAIPPH